MAIPTYNDLGKLHEGDQQPLVLDNIVLNVLEINPKQFTDLINFDELTLDTFTTNLVGNPTPELCTGMAYATLSLEGAVAISTLLKLPLIVSVLRSNVPASPVAE